MKQYFYVLHISLTFPLSRLPFPQHPPSPSKMDPNDHLNTLSETNDVALLSATLEELGTFICIGMEDFVKGIDAKRSIQVLLGVLKKTDNEHVLVCCHRCIALMLEYVPHSAEALIGVGAVPMITETLKTTFSLDMIEELLKTLRQVAVDDNTGVLVHCGAVPAIINSMERQDRRLHPSSIAILESIIVKINIDSAGPKPAKVKRMFSKSASSAATPPSPAVVIDAIRNQIIPSLRGLLGTLCVQDLDQGGARDVAAALCSCISTLAERCHRSVPDLLDVIVQGSFVSELVGLLKTSVQGGDDRQQSVVLKTLGILCSISPAALVPRLLSETALLDICTSLLHPKEQDFSATLQDPFGLQREQERLSGGPPTKSSLDLRGDVLYLLYCMSPSLPGNTVCSIPGAVSRLHQWEWEDDYHAFNPYESSTQSVLEAAFQQGSPQASAPGRGNTYTVDIHCMKQYNPGSGVSRNVKRHALPAGYRREESRPESAPEKTPSVTKKISGSLRKEKKEENVVGVKAVEGLKPESGLGGENGAVLARRMFSTFAVPLAKYAVQCGEPSRREWAAETLARTLHVAAAAGKAKPNDTTTLSEVHDNAPALVAALVTLIGKGVSEPLLLDLALLSVDILCLLGPTVPQQLRKAGLMESLSAVQGQAKSLPPKLARRAAGCADCFGAAAAAPVVSEVGKRLGRLANELGEGGNGVFGKILEIFEESGGDLCGSELLASNVVRLVLQWVGCGDAAERHRHLDEFAHGASTHPRGAENLARLLTQSAVAMEVLPITTPLYSAFSSSSPRRSSAPAATRRTADSFLQMISRKGIKVRFNPCPVGEAEGHVSTVDPFATLACLERFFMYAKKTGKLPSTNGMKVLRGASVRAILEGFASGGESGSLQELLRRMGEDEGFEDEDDDEDEDEGGDMQEVVILDSSRVSLYDEPSTDYISLPEGTDAPDATAPYPSFAFYIGTKKIPKTATMLEVLRQHCIQKGGLRKMENMFAPFSSNLSEHLAKLDKKAAQLKQKVQKFAGKRDKKTKPNAEEVEAKAKLEHITQKMSELRTMIEVEDSFDPWEVVIDLRCEPETLPESCTPEIFLSDVEAEHWRLDQTVHPIFNTQFTEDMGDPVLVSHLQLLRLLFFTSEGLERPLPADVFVSPHLTAKLVQSLSGNALRVAAFGRYGLPAWTRALTTHCSFLFSAGARREYAGFVSAGASKAFLQLMKMRNCISAADVIQPEVLPPQGGSKMIASRTNLEPRANALLGATTWRRFPLEVQYDNEEGTGLGPTLEFFTIVSRDLQKSGHHMWVGDAAGEYVLPPAGGLYPSVRVCGDEADADQIRFEMLGRLAARAVLDGRLLDIPLAPALLRILKGIASESQCCPDNYLKLSDLSAIDERMAQSIKFFIDFATEYDAETSSAKRRKISETADLVSQEGAEGIPFIKILYKKNLLQLRTTLCFPGQIFH